MRVRRSLDGVGLSRPFSRQEALKGVGMHRCTPNSAPRPLHGLRRSLVKCAICYAASGGGGLEQGAVRAAQHSIPGMLARVEAAVVSPTT